MPHSFVKVFKSYRANKKRIPTTIFSKVSLSVQLRSCVVSDMPRFRMNNQLLSRTDAILYDVLASPVDCCSRSDLYFFHKNTVFPNRAHCPLSFSRTRMLALDCDLLVNYRSAGIDQKGEGCASDSGTTAPRFVYKSPPLIEASLADRRSGLSSRVWGGSRGAGSGLALRLLMCLPMGAWQCSLTTDSADEWSPSGRIFLSLCGIGN